MIPVRSTSLKIAISAIAAAALAAIPASADIIKLKNGETLEGVVVSRDKGYITILVPSGEMGLDASFVDSIDTEKGPRTKEDLAKLQEASRARSEDANSAREAAMARNRAAAQAAEASARRETPESNNINNTNDGETATGNAAAARVVAIEDALLQIQSRREREKVRRFLYNFYFGGGNYDPVLRVAR